MDAGFIGLGTLGKPMAQRLLRQGVTLAIWNRTPQKARDFAEIGNAVVADTPARLLAQTDIVFLNLRDSDAVESVLTGPEGLLQGNMAGKLVIDTTTNHFAQVTAFHKMVAEAGGAYLEAPVAGSVVPATNGTLTILVSGKESDLARARPYLEHLGTTIFHLETPGLATRMKLINNVVLGTFMATLAEAVALGEAAGITKADVLEILAAGGGNSGVLRAKTAKLQEEDFSTHFSGAMIHKDLHYAGELARALNRPLFTGGLTKELFGLMFLDGTADEDFAAIYKQFKNH